MPIDEGWTRRALEANAHPEEDVVLIFPRSQYHAVKEWHQAFDLPVADEPRMLPEDRVDLRIDLITEELNEVIEALSEGDIEHIAKELGDLSWVVQGLAVEMGIDLDLVVKEIKRSNMSKLDRDGNPIFRGDGKVLKGPDYVEADIAKVLYR